MDSPIMKYCLMFILLIMLQALIFNHIYLFSVAMAFVFVYFIVSLPMGLSTGWVIMLSFMIGFCVDVFSDTSGVNSLSCVLLAALRKPIFFAYVPKDDKTKIITPSLRTLGWPAYTKYLLTMCAVYSLLNYSIEYFSIAHVKDIIILSSSSALFTFLMTLLIGCIYDRKRGRD